ncbi:MAG: acyltransferase [Bacteroidetes bacterium]|nr:MAG: acyltransferase [Bacteroidota bacterium]
MLRIIFRLIFFLKGWKLDDALLKEHNISRCVMLAAPHTSNWDGVFLIAAFLKMGAPIRFTLKKEWMRFPLNYLIGPLGAIGIDRSPKDGSTERISMVDAMANLYKDGGEMYIVIAIEGSRSPRDEWKTGFYYVAQKAEVPIICGYLDYKNRVAGVGKIIHPSGDVEADMQDIVNFYRDITPCIPENFVLDKKYQ